jgi:predicted nucleic acid-binding protein
MSEQAIDASVAIKWVRKSEPFRHKARQLLHDAQVNGVTLIAPPLLLYELESILQRHWFHGTATTAVADKLIAAFYSVGVQIHSHADMVERARAIARQFQQERIYDSLYAALAELRGCDLWTADKAFYDAVKAGLSFVKYLPDYP